MQYSMSFRDHLIVLALVVSFTGGIVPAGAQIPQEPGKAFDLRVGETVLIGATGWRLGFDTVTADSRCPIGVFCIWEGNARARLFAQFGRDPRQVFELNTHSGFRTRIELGGYSIELLDVAPYPEYGKTIEPSDYVVTMLVETASPAVATDETTWGAIKALYNDDR